MKYTRVRRAVSAVMIDSYDEDRNPELVKVNGAVTFTPLLKDGDVVQWAGPNGPQSLVLAPIECFISNGIIMHRGGEGVYLAAGGEGCEPSLIQWKATFSGMQAGGWSFKLKPVMFDAVPDGEVDLTMVAPVAGASEPIVRGPAGTGIDNIKVDGAELVITARSEAGVFEMARIPLEDVVRAEADAAAAAAVDGVETVLAATVDAANAARDDAKGHADRTEDAASTATSAAGEASQFRDAAATSETNAAQSEADAAGFAELAEQYKNAAGVHESNAAQSETNAAQSEANAAASEQTAATSASKAATSEANAQDSATAAAGSAAESAAHADRAEQAADSTGLRDEITQQLADLVDGAPEDLDTIREVAEYAQANRDITDALNAAIGNKANKTHTHSQSQVTGLTTALSNKADKTHTHETSQVVGLDNALAGKADKAHTHAQSDITGLSTALGNKADKTHTHSQSQITGLSTALSGKADTGHKHPVSDLTDYPGHTAKIGPSSYGKIPTREADSDNLRVGYPPSQTYHATSKKYVDEEVAKKANTSHTHTTADITNFSTEMGKKANKSHTHSQSDITGLSTTLSGKADSTHTHTQGEVTGLTTALNGKAAKSHTHTTSQISGLGTALNGKASTQALADGLATRVEGGTAVKKIEVVTAMPSTPVATTLYLVVG